MIRLGFALAITAVIFVQSPARQSKSLTLPTLASTGGKRDGDRLHLSGPEAAALLLRLKVQATRDTGTR